ncbi:Calcium-binding EF-hand [Cynara cardunculus var. scolymus]|uniref:Calcium-binding EF-hand n=2 Tax=Cynara cardunculus var. scolymus TaxID=59895 RepID=A0A103XU38_CYNCS|nr:Calcium-binding EF-hand [Cynara cardunculus var. scolymus]
MIEKLGAEGFMNELYKGFESLEDRDTKGFITFESLKRNASWIGLEKMNDDELRCILREGDVDGDGKLSEMEFCVLMFRLSPGLMDGSHRWLESTILMEFM